MTKSEWIMNRTEELFDAIDLENEPTTQEHLELYKAFAAGTLGTLCREHAIREWATLS